MKYRLLPGGISLVFALLLPGCVIRADGSHEEPIPDIEMYASTGEALDTVSQAGLLSLREVLNARDQYSSLLEDIEPIVEERPEDTILRHQRNYLAETEAFYEALIPLYEQLKDASVDSKPGLTSEVYEVQRAYLEALVSTDEDMDLPESVAAGFAMAGIKSADEEDLQVPVDLNESEILTLYNKGEYQELVAKVAEVGQVNQRLSPQGRAVYALALAEQGLDAEAKKQVRALEQLHLLEPELFAARSALALWLFSEDARGEAEQVLNRLRSDCDIAALSLGQEKRVVVGMLEEMSLGAREVDLVAARKALEEEDFLEARILLEGIRNSEAAADVKNRVEWMLGLLATREEATFEKELASVRAMAKVPTRVPEAETKLDAMRIEYPTERFASRLDAVALELNRPNTSEESSPEERLAGARSLLNAEKYELAIAEFESLYGTPAAAEAKAGRDKTVDLYVHEVRENMARDYLAANKINDPQEKLKALGTIHDKLTEVSRKYPGSRLAPKINTNAQVVKADILRIEPSYFD